MSFYVNSDDIRKGSRGNANCCMIVQTLRRYTNSKIPISAHVPDAENALVQVFDNQFPLSDSVTKKMRAFDEGKGVKPFHFEQSNLEKFLFPFGKNHVK